VKKLALLAMVAACWSPASAHAWADLDFGCQHPTWAGNTTQWHLMSNYMSGDLSAAQVAQIITDSFSEWDEPGCSDFTATQTGTTSGIVPDNNGSIVFFENSVGWPADPNILAYATPTPGAGCSIASSAIVFNAVTYTWSAGGGNDLQSVMTHEVGHWIGLDHSSHGGATMAACYSGGTGDQVLSCDDTEGICTLYPSGATTCNERGGDEYCPCTEKCEEGTCVPDPEATPGPGEQAASADGCDGEGSGGDGEGDPDGGGPGGGSPPDSDGDGISDWDEGTGDTDGDGTPDFLDEDSDDDGISDADEGGDPDSPFGPPDTDGDGEPDFTDPDSDGDGIPDVEEGPFDSDGDGDPDFLDEDSDDDGIPDEEEGDDDSDGDGDPDYTDPDPGPDNQDEEQENESADDDDWDGGSSSDQDGNGYPDWFDQEQEQGPEIMLGCGCNEAGGGPTPALGLLVLLPALLRRRR